jgi:hypothetical protein
MKPNDTIIDISLWILSLTIIIFSSLTQREWCVRVRRYMGMKGINDAEPKSRGCGGSKAKDMEQRQGRLGRTGRATKELRALDQDI